MQAASPDPPPHPGMRMQSPRGSEEGRTRRPREETAPAARALSLPNLPSLVSTLFPLFQLEEEIQDDLKWSIRVNAVLHSGKSAFQSVELVDSGPFGKVRGGERGRREGKME